MFLSLLTRRSCDTYKIHVFHVQVSATCSSFERLISLYVLLFGFFRCDSPEKLKAILPRLEQELRDTGKFKDFYQFTFNFAKNPGQKGLGKHLFFVFQRC